MPKPLQPTEHEIQAGILEYLLARGYYVWRNNSGGFRKGDYFVKVGKKGSADIIGIHRDGSGRFLAIEVKRPGGKATPEQLEFIGAINMAGGKAFVAHSVDEVINELR